MEIHKRHQAQGTKPVETTVFHEPDFVLVQDFRPPPRIELARERMLMCRLYLGLIRSMTEDYGAVFSAHNDSSTFRTIGIYVFLRTVMCSPVSASKIAHALKLPRVIVVRRLQEMLKHGYVERVGNAYRVTDKVNIPDLKIKLQRRMDMIVETARKLSELNSSPELGPVADRMCRRAGQASSRASWEAVWWRQGPTLAGSRQRIVAMTTCRNVHPPGWPHIGVGYTPPCRSIMQPKNFEEASCRKRRRSAAGYPQCSRTRRSCGKIRSIWKAS